MDAKKGIMGIGQIDAYLQNSSIFLVGINHEKLLQSRGEEHSPMGYLATIL